MPGGNARAGLPMQLPGSKASTVKLTVLMTDFSTLEMTAAPGPSCARRCSALRLALAAPGALAQASSGSQRSCSNHELHVSLLPARPPPPPSPYCGLRRPSITAESHCTHTPDVPAQCNRHADRSNLNACCGFQPFSHVITSALPFPPSLPTHLPHRRRLPQQHRQPCRLSLAASASYLVCAR